VLKLRDDHSVLQFAVSAHGLIVASSGGLLHVYRLSHDWLEAAFANSDDKTGVDASPIYVRTQVEDVPSGLNGYLTSL
jgi:hypothetical protein